MVNKTAQPVLSRFYELERAAGLVGELPLPVMSYDKRSIYQPPPTPNQNVRNHDADADNEQPNKQTNNHGSYYTEFERQQDILREAEATSGS